MRQLCLLFCFCLCLGWLSDAQAQFEFQRAVTRVVSGNSLGTGCVFHIAKDGAAYVLTNNHVAGREGNRAVCEFWNEDGKRWSASGRVIWSVINQGYLDAAVIELTPESLGGRTPAVIPLAKKFELTDSRGPQSSGCPGGRWPSLFRAQMINANEDRVQFFPKPGGGRSGSALFDAECKEIIGLIAWSTGGNPQQHNLDGRHERDGNGIAMPIEKIWAALEGRETGVEVSRTETPIGIQVPQFCPDESEPELIDEASLRENQRQQDENARLLRLRESLRNESPKALPRILPQPQRPVVSTFRFVLVAILLTAGGIVIFFMVQMARGKITLSGLTKAFFGASILPLAIAGSSATPAVAQDLETLLKRHSAQPVAALPMMDVDRAIEDSKASGRISLIMVKMVGCGPCEKMADELESLVLAGNLNNVNLAGVFNDDIRGQKLMVGKQQLFPTLILYRPVNKVVGWDTEKWVHVSGFQTRNQIKALLRANGLEPITSEEACLKLYSDQ